MTSIYNLLQTLKAEGYDVGQLPDNVSQLEDMIIKSGINVATWAPGELEKLANRSNVVLLPVMGPVPGRFLQQGLGRYQRTFQQA